MNRNMNNEQIIRIAELAESDQAYPYARWAILGPRWVGDHIEIRLIKTQTLETAITLSERSRILDDLSVPPEGAMLKAYYPQTISAMKSTLERARTRRAKGVEADWSAIFNR